MSKTTSIFSCVSFTLWCKFIFSANCELCYLVYCGLSLRPVAASSVLFTGTVPWALRAAAIRKLFVAQLEHNHALIQELPLGTGITTCP